MPAKAKAKPPLPKLQVFSFKREIVGGKSYWSHTPPPLVEVQAGNVKWRPIWCAGYEVDEKGEKHYHHIECIPCHCKPGPQIQALFTRAREIALWGGRGSAKSEATFAFLVRGNIPTGTKEADQTYLNCPDYAALVIRKNAKDLRNYFERAKRFFALFGGEPTLEPMGIKFPSGAYMIFDHMADGDAWEKYQGPEWTRMVIEEAPQIGEEINYLKLIAACRTSNPDMTAQIMLTANPGGSGWAWFKARFLRPEGRRQRSNDPYTDPFSGRTRVHIKSCIDDNPISLAKGYDKDLDLYKASSTSLYKQWRFGDPDVVAGQFFEAFRERGLEAEPENACHTKKPCLPDPYWPMAIGMDYGYSHPSVALWGYWHPNGQLNVFKEYLATRTGPFELGVEVATRTLPLLQRMSNPHVILFLSHDAFARESDAASEADRIAKGIDSVLGVGATFVFDPTEEEKLLGKEASWESMKRRHEKRMRNTYITVVNAGMRRRANMNLIRDYLRWWSLNPASMEFNDKVYRSILERDGCVAAIEYEKKCQANSTETLPVLQVHYDPDAPDPRDRGCERLVASLLAAVEEENKPEEMKKQDGDDPVDALAYLAGNFPFQTAVIPVEEQTRRKILAIREKNPDCDYNGLVMSARRIEASKPQTGGFNFARVAGPTRRRVARAVA